MIGKEYNIPENNPIHPGEILLEEYLKPLNITPREFAKHINNQTDTIIKFIQGDSRMSGRLAWRLSQAFGTSPQIWMNLQSTYDLSNTRPQDDVGTIVEVVDNNG